MVINWFTVLAQIFNFLILLFVLNKILYKPIFNFVQKRKEDIDNKINYSRKIAEETEEKKDEYVKKINDFELEKKNKKKQLLEQLESEKNKKLKIIEKEIQREKKKLIKQLEKDRSEIINSTNKIVMEKFVKFTKTIFKSMPDTQLESQMVLTFMEKLKKLTQKELTNINNLIKKNKGTVEILTSSAINQSGKKFIQDSLKKNKIHFTKINFKSDSELIRGINVKIGNYHIGWNLREILEKITAKTHSE